jgi:branched-chain amino acid transport system substrate-binding protein
MMHRPRSTHRPIAVAGALIALALATTACASKGGSSTSGSSGSGPIHLGLIADYTGQQSYLGPDMESGVRTALAAINAAGGVMGRQVDLSTGDTVGDPVDAIPAFRKMISTNHVVAMVGPTSNEGPALLPIAKASKIPMFLQGGTTALDHETNPFYFRTTVGDGSLGKAMAAYATSKHLMKAAFAFTTSTAAQTLVQPIKQAYTAKGGSVVAEVHLVPSASSYRSQIQTLMAAKPDVVFLQQDPQTAGTFFHQAAELGFDNQTTWVGSDTEMSEDIF